MVSPEKAAERRFIKNPAHPKGQRELQKTFMYPTFMFHFNALPSSQTESDADCK